MTKAGLGVHAVLAALLVAGLGVSPAPAQPGAGALVDVDADPIRCWWQADRGAVQIGEPLTITLTCAVVETDAARVVVDRSRLDPSVLTLSPFDVTGGTQPADTVTGSRRFFQYSYVLNLINENAIGRDLIVPELSISYRIESRTGDDSSLAGRDRTYELPPLPIRVVSLVAADAPDIREAAQGGFESFQARELRGRLLKGAAVACFVLAALLAFVALRRAFGGERDATRAPARVTDRAIIQGAARVLAEARGALRHGSPDDASAGRALDALRVIGAYAAGRSPAQAASASRALEEPGQLRLRSGWLGGRHAIVSASTTAAVVADQAAALPESAGDRRLKLEALAAALSHLTASRYGTPPVQDASELDDAIGLSLQLANDLAREHSWTARQTRATLATLTAFGARVWTR